jgi:hypothetical protein
MNIYTSEIEYLKDKVKQLEEALSKQEQGEPVGQLLEDAFGRGQVMWFNKPKDESMLYTTPQQRTWVGLDPEEIRKTNHHMVDGAYHYSFKQGAEWAEAKLKEKNT